MSKAIISDVDGSLAFGRESHGVEVVEKLDTTYRVRVPDSSIEHQAYDISTDKYNVYFALNTRSLLRTLAGRHKIILATGARPSTVHSRREAFNFVDGVILENGGMILDHNYEIDRGWKAHLDPDRQYLREAKKRLESRDWNLDVEGRTSALRIRFEDNPHKSEGEFQELCQRISLPDELQTTTNLGSLDIILRSAGKAQALRYLAEKNDYTETIGIGDDVNDLDFLSVTDQSFVLRNAPIEVRKLAKRKGWHVSKQPYFKGIEEILQRILMS